MIKEPVYENNKEAFLLEAGDNWLERNRHDLGKYTIVTDTIDRCKIKPRRVLDIGCSNGWHMMRMREKYDCEIYGVEPSSEGVKEGNAKIGKDVIFKGTSDSLPFGSNTFDLVVFGFSLFFVSVDNWFATANEVNRVLTDGGHIVIYDYNTPRAFLIQNAGQVGTNSYFNDWTKLWLWHPAYSFVDETILTHKAQFCAILKKQMAHCIPEYK